MLVTDMKKALFLYRKKGVDEEQGVEMMLVDERVENRRLGERVDKRVVGERVAENFEEMNV